MKKISTAHLLLLATLISQLLLSFILMVCNVSLSMVAALLFSQASIILPFVVYCIVKKENPLKLLRFKKISFSTAMLSVFAALCSYPVVVLLNMISMLFVDNAMVSVMPQVLSMGVVPALILMAFLPAVVEETIFRGVLYNTYSKRKPILGIFLSALLFGLMHMNFNQMPYAFYLGIIMALVMEASDSILAPMIVHFTMNASSTILSFFSMSTLEDASELTASTDMKELFMESYKTSMEQMGMELTDAQLNAMMPAILTSVIVMFAIMAIVSLAIVLTLVYAVFRTNGRKLKAVFQQDHSDTACITCANGKVKKNRMIDLWVILFILYTLINCIISAVS